MSDSERHHRLQELDELSKQIAVRHLEETREHIEDLYRQAFPNVFLSSCHAES